MKTHLIRSTVLLFAGALLLAGRLGAQDKSGDLAIIVNKSVKVDDVASADLVRYFKAEKSKAADGSKLALAVFDVGHPERAAALAGIYKMSEGEYTDYFADATFTGAVAAAPKALASAAAVRAFVAGTAGGLGYVRGSDTDDSVKVLKVDGALPGDAGYKLKIK